jgi:hypothetical protein
MQEGKTWLLCAAVCLSVQHELHNVQSYNDVTVNERSCVATAFVTVTQNIRSLRCHTLTPNELYVLIMHTCVVATPHFARNDTVSLGHYAHYVTH